ACVLSRDLAVLQSIADLAGEIAALEQEVIRKELHLLTLYRRAFDQQLSDSWKYASLNFCISQEVSSRPASKHSSLVNFLNASISDYVPKISCKLSEDILGCIASVYCKLASTP
uniref:Uncharacterized protein n=1 Tax=Aegilops tauschii subsp. strangulata TaxID=200361 RepID=A0A453L5X9_AEGTS